MALDMAVKFTPILALETSWIGWFFRREIGMFSEKVINWWRSVLNTVEYCLLWYKKHAMYLGREAKGQRIHWG